MVDAVQKTRAAISTSQKGGGYLTKRGGSYSLTEKNTNLQGTKSTGTVWSIGEWEQMLKTNPTAHVGYLSMLATLSNVRYTVEVPDGCPARIAKFVKRLLGSALDKRWPSYVSTILRAPAFGFAPHEIVSKLGDDGLWYIKDLAYRPPRTFDLASVYLDDAGYTHATQTTIERDGSFKTTSYGSPDSGAAWLWWPTFGDGLFGESILRPIWNEHKEKEDIRKIRRIAIQKSLFGTQVLMVDPSTDMEDEAVQSQIEDTVDEIGDIICHEQGAAYVPGWCRDIKTLYADSKAIEQSIAAENHDDVQILLNFAGQWMARGLLAAYGSNAASVTDQGEQRNLKRYFLDWLKSQVQWLIDWYVDFNFGPQEFYPELGAIYRDEASLKEEVDAAVRLAAAKGLAFDAPLRAHFRSMFGWPEETHEAIDALTAQASTPPAQPGNRYQEDAPDERQRESTGDYT